MIQGVLFDLAGGGLSFGSAIPFVVIHERESKTSGRLVVRACGEAGRVAIPVGGGLWRQKERSL